VHPAVPHCNLPALHAALHQYGMLEGAQVDALRDTLHRTFAQPPTEAGAIGKNSESDSIHGRA
jgi:hypothetical protein